jgi:catechol 2,3-dioxygenase-like lactoylglutathione lyase family enzyme
MEIEVLGLDHIYITVSEMLRSEMFYDKVMKVLGFRKVIRPIGNQPHVHYFNRCMRYTIRPAASTRSHNQNSPGLHHLCFQVRDQQSVDVAAKLLRQCGVEASEPRLYPEYTPDYYATFLHDPDGIELEIVNRFKARDETVKNWDNYKPISESSNSSTVAQQSVAPDHFVWLKWW